MKNYKYLLLLIAALITNSPCKGQFNSWRKIGDMPYPVAGGRAVVIDTTIFVFGGYSDSVNANVDLIQAFYPQSGTWEIVGNLPQARYGFIAGVINGDIVLCGGIDEIPKQNASLQVISRDTTGFSFYSDTTFNYNRMFSAGLIENSELYLFGGLPASGVADTNDKAYIVRYDIAGQNTIFENKNIYNGEFPIQQMAAPLNNSIFLFGGVHNGILKQIYRFDPDSNTYTKLNTSLLEPRAGGEAISYPEFQEIFLIGGYNENSDALFSVEKVRFYPDFILIDQQEPLNDARKEFMSVRYGNFMFIMGGRDENNEVISSIEIMEYYVATSVNDEVLKKDFSLYQNYPNPFNPGTVISFNIPRIGKVKLGIYSVLGELIKEFEESELNAGTHKIYWNGTDNNGSIVPAGVYFSRLEYDSRLLTGKMILVK